jgi:hypothetical protein
MLKNIMPYIPVIPDYLLSKSWTLEMMAKDMFEISKEECPTFDGTLEGYIKGMKNPHMRRFFLFNTDSNKIEGYLSARNLSLEYRNKVVNGTFTDFELLDGMVAFENEAYIYVSGFVLSKKARLDHANFKKILAVFIEFIVQLISQDIIIKEITARGLTPMGQQLCEGLGMTKIIPHREKGIIYGVSFDWDEKPKHASALYNAIQKTKAKRLLQQLMGLGGKKGMPIVKDALSSWGYRTEEN